MARGFHGKHTEEAKRRIAEASKGNQHRLGSVLTLETRLKMSLSHKGVKKTPEHIRNAALAKIGLKRPDMLGANNRNWDGGVTSENNKARKSAEYKLWREAVFKRDDYTCQACSARGSKGNKVVLNADHIKPFAYFPELRFAIDNGNTLCVDCHRKTDTWGAGKKPRK